MILSNIYRWPTEVIIELSAVSHQCAIYSGNLTIWFHSFLWIKCTITQFQLYAGKFQISGTDSKCVSQKHIVSDQTVSQCRVPK